MTPDQIAKNGEFSEEDLEQEAMNVDDLEKVSGGADNRWLSPDEPDPSKDNVIVHSKEDIIIGRL